jgi:hypothetical protein
MYSLSTLRISEFKTRMLSPILEIAALYSFSPESENFVLMFGMLLPSAQVFCQRQRLLRFLWLAIWSCQCRKQTSRRHGLPEKPLRHAQLVKPDCQKAGKIKAAVLL